MEEIFTSGAELRKEREARGLSQAELSILSGISPQSKHIAKIERGDIDPRISTALKISRGLISVEIPTTGLHHG